MPDFSVLRRLDLNLLVILADLLDSQSVSRTAERLGRTQPAVSLSLSRLRAHLGDPLLIRSGSGLRLSPLGEKLRGPLAEQLSALGKLLDANQPFDPATSTRQVVLAGEDLVSPQLLELSRRIRKSAPHLRIMLRGKNPEVVDLAMGRVDLALMMYPEPVPRTVACRPLGDLPWVIVAPADHPIPERPSLEDWLAHGHVRVAKGEAELNPIDTAIGQEAAARRRIEMRVESFLQAIYMVGAGDLLFATIGGMVDPIARRYGYRILPAPFPIAPVPTALWHRPATTGPFSEWLAKIVASFHLQT